MVDLRTLAQAYLHAREVDAVSVDLTASREVTRAGLALGAALGTPSTVPPAAHAAAIIAALDAERAQGYARAMGEVVERADHSADYTGWSDYALGHRDAHERLAVWARERLPAEAERD